MALEALRRIQAGREATAAQGTAVVADKVWIGTLTMTPNITFHRPVDERQSLAEFRRVKKVAQRGTLRYEADATYEQIIDFLAMSVRGNRSSSDPSGASNAKLWNFTPRLTASNNQDSFTVEYGDDTRVWQAKFAIITTLEMAFAADETVKLNADIVSNLPVPLVTGFTDNLVDPEVNEIATNECEVFIDGTWAALGTTKKGNLVNGGTIRLTTGITPRQRLDGSFDFARFTEMRRHLEVDLDVVANTDGSTEYDAWVNQTDRAIKLKFTGPAIETGFDNEFEVDIFGKYMNDPNLFDAADGENLFRLSLASHDDGLTHEFSFGVQNNVDAY